MPTLTLAKTVHKSYLTDTLELLQNLNLNQSISMMIYDFDNIQIYSLFDLFLWKQTRGPSYLIQNAYNKN